MKYLDELDLTPLEFIWLGIIIIMATIWLFLIIILIRVFI